MVQAEVSIRARLKCGEDQTRDVDEEAERKRREHDQAAHAEMLADLEEVPVMDTALLGDPVAHGGICGTSVMSFSFKPHHLRPTPDTGTKSKGSFHWGLPPSGHCPVIS